MQISIIALGSLIVMVFFILLTITLHIRNLREKHKLDIRLASKQLECDNYVAQIDIMNQHCISLKKSLLDTQGKYKRHLEKLKPEFRNLFEQLQRTQHQRTEIYNKYNTLSETFSKVVEENKQLQLQIQSLSIDLTSIKSQYDEMQNADYEKSNDDILELAKKTTVINSLTIENKKLLFHISELKADQDRISSLKDEINQLKSQLSLKEFEIIELKREKELSDETVARYQDQIARFDVLRNRLENLEHIQDVSSYLVDHKLEIEELRSSISTIGQVPIQDNIKVHDDTGPFISHSNSDTLIHNLNNFLSKLTKDTKIRAAVISDTIGLIVAETGQRSFTEGLAGISASFDSFGQNVQAMIPFGVLQQLTMLDHNNVSVAAYPVKINNESLIVSVITEGPALLPELIYKLLCSTFDRDSITFLDITKSDDNFIIAKNVITTNKQPIR